jgi:hypothetical protein
LGEREKTQINKIRDENGDITTNTNEVWRIFRKYFESLYSNKLEKFEEIDKFLDKYNLPKLDPRGYKPHKQIYNKQ